MPSLISVSLKDSIATKLLTVVFSIYFLITLTVTLLHMATEYYTAKSSILQDLQVFEKAFAPGLGQALWEVDYGRLQSLIVSLLEIPIIGGVQIRDEFGDSIAATGIVADKRGQAVQIDATGKRLGERSNEGLLGGLFWQEFPISHRLENGEVAQVGKVVFYSSTEIVFNKVRYGFFFIIINSIIKTLALWIIFLWVARNLLSRPLHTMTQAAESLSLDNLENFRMDLRLSGRNELKVLEQAFNSMIQKLLLAKERMTSLREFSNKIAEFQETTELMRFVFQELGQHIHANNTIWFFHYQDGRFNESESFNHSHEFLKKAPTFQLLDKLFSEESQELHLSNQTPTESPLNFFYLETHGVSIPGSHFLFLRWQHRDPHIICLFREAQQPPFDQADLEYVKNMFNQINILKNNLQIILQHSSQATQYRVAQSQMLLGMVDELSGRMGLVRYGAERFREEMEMLHSLITGVMEKANSREALNEAKTILEKRLKESAPLLPQLQNRLGELELTLRDFRGLMELDGTIREPIALPELLREELAQAREAMEQDAEDVQALLNISGQPTIINNPFVLSRAFRNLFQNALFYAFYSQAPTLRVKVEKAEAGYYIHISNNGPPIGPITEHKIFEAYFTTRRAKDKRGTGLFLIKRMLEEQSGRIILSDNGVHSGWVTFSVYLPQDPSLPVPSQPRPLVDARAA